MEIKLSKTEIVTLLSSKFEAINAYALTEMIMVHNRPGALLCTILDLLPIVDIPKEAVINGTLLKVISFNPLSEKQIRASTINPSINKIKRFRQGDIDYVPEFLEFTLEEWIKGSSKVFNQQV